MQLRVFLVSLAALSMFVAAACNEGADAPDVGARDAGATDAALGVTPPDISWLAEGVPPVDWPCAEGWRASTVHGATVCDPYPEGGPVACARGQAHFVGESACAQVGAACPTGAFAEGLPTSNVIYVDDDAAPGGDGTLAAPLDTIASVRWSSLASDTTVAIAKGAYEGALPLREGVIVVGACAEETILTGVAAPIAAVVSVTSAGAPAVVRNLTIADPPQQGVLVTDGRSLVLDGVVIDGAIGAAVLADGAAVDVTVRNSVLENGRAESDGRFGLGARARNGAHLVLERVLVHHNRDLGVFAQHAETSVELRRTAVVETQARDGDRMNGRGIGIEAGAHLSATALFIGQNLETGLYLWDAGTDVSLTETVIRGTRQRISDGAFGTGLQVKLGAHLEATRIWLDDNRQSALTLVDPSTTVVLADALAADTGPERDTFGHGIDVVAGAHLEVLRSVIANNTEVGVLVSQTGSFVSLTDVLVIGTRASASDGQLGDGIVVLDEARLEGRRIVAAENREGNVVVGLPGASAVFEDMLVRDSLARDSDGVGGYALMVARGGVLDGARIAVERAAAAGILSLDDSTATLTDVSVIGVDTPCLTGEDCTDRPGGYGIATTSTLRLDRFRIDDIATCGVLIAVALGPTSLDLANGVVSRAAIGACVQVDGYDVSRLTREVVYRDNGVNLDATSLPVPVPVGLGD